MSDEKKSVSRRDALKVLGAVPVAAAVGLQQPTTKKPLTPAVTSQIPSHAPAAAASAPSFFSAHEWRTVHVLVDYIIPRDERSGSATDAKVPEYMDFLLADKDTPENQKVAMHGGLAWLDNECRDRFGKSFVAASDAQRRQVLDDIAYPKTARPEMRHGVMFFNHFRDMTASGFFSSAMGWKDVQYIGNVVNPGYDGCPPAALEKLGVSYDVMNTRIAPENK